MKRQTWSTTNFTWIILRWSCRIYLVCWWFEIRLTSGVDAITTYFYDSRVRLFDMQTMYSVKKTGINDMKREIARIIKECMYIVYDCFFLIKFMACYTYRCYGASLSKWLEIHKFWGKKENLKLDIAWYLRLKFACTLRLSENMTTS